MGKKKKKNSTSPARRAATPGLVVLTSPEEVTEHERIDIFEIDGVTYSIERKPNVGVGIGYLRRVATEGQDAAVGFLLTATLGVEAMEALETYEDLTPENLKDIMARVKAYALGGLEGPKGS